MSHKDYN